MSPNCTQKIDQQGNMLIVYLYVDDMIYTGNLELVDFKSTMQREFEMISLGLMKFFIWIEVKQTKK